MTIAPSCPGRIQGYSFSREVPVGEGDVDEQGRLLQSRTLAHLEASVARFLEARGFRWPCGERLLLTEATLVHRGGAVDRGDALTVAVRPSAIGYSALQFQAAVHKSEGGRLEEARLVYAVVDAESRRRRPVPASLVGALLRPA